MPGLFSFKKKIRSGYALSILLLVISYCLIFYLQQRLVKEARWVEHSYTVIGDAESLKSELTSAETGLRGYVLTQDTQFLRPYNESIGRIPVLLKELRDLIADNKDQSEKLDTLSDVVIRRTEMMKTGLADYLANGFKITPEMRLKRPVSLHTMDSMRLYVAKLKDAEQALMDGRQDKLSQLFGGVKAMAIISLAIVFAALLYSILTFNFENKAREKADKRANKYRVDLESNKTELKEKDMELKELKDHEKFTSTGRIARTIAHEVRNPLTNILLATEQLQETETKNEESPILLELINRNVARINQLVSDLLDATRFSHLDFTTADINHLVEETLVMAKDRLDLSQVAVQKIYSEEVCEISVDREKIKLALLNIIVNAIEAIETKDGLLEIKTRKHGNKCIVEIRDNGKGMEEEELQRMFEPYFTSKQKGNGLGMTNTQNIILNHKGKINVYSKPGKGTTVLIALDLIEVQVSEQ